MNQYNTLRELVQIDSPTGFTHQACDYILKTLTNYGWSPKLTHKGSVTCSLGLLPKLAIAAHTDTLGAIVAGINGDGTLRISKIGGLLLNSFEGKYCRIYTLQDKVYTGTLLLNNPSAHTNREAESTKRIIDNMHIRIDEEVEHAEDVVDLGIQVGDFIAFDPAYQELPSGFIKSNFMDNKACCFVLFEIARLLKDYDFPIELVFTNYEEVGHGGAGVFSDTVEQILVLDMGVVGDNCAGSETHCSICAKDSSGPYDYTFRKRLVQVAEQHEIPYKLDIYPYYGSDGSVALRAGYEVQVALIGPGVAASHGAERTHKKGIEATVDLCLAYIKECVK